MKKKKISRRGGTRSLPDAANEGFLFIARKAGAAVRLVEGVVPLYPTRTSKSPRSTSKDEDQRSATKTRHCDEAPERGPGKPRKPRTPEPPREQPSSKIEPSRPERKTAASTPHRPPARKTSSSVSSRDAAPPPASKSMDDAASSPTTTSQAKERGIIKNPFGRGEAGTSRQRSALDDLHSPSSRRGRDVNHVIEQLSKREDIDTLSLRLASREFLHGSEEERRRALEILLAFGLHVEPLLVAAVDDESQEVTALALDALSQPNSDRLSESIGQLMRSRDPRRRLVALQEAQHLEDDRARNFILSATGDPSPEVRRKVVSYLSWRMTSWSLAALRGLCGDEDKSVRTAAVEALELSLESLAASGLERLIRHLEELIEAPKVSVRLIALRVAQRLDDEQARPFLVRGARDTSPEVRRRVVSYLSWRSGLWALTEIRLLCRDGDVKVRWAAIEVLAGLKPTEVRSLLERLSPREAPLQRQRVLAVLAQGEERGEKSPEAPSSDEVLDDEDQYGDEEPVEGEIEFVTSSEAERKNHRDVRSVGDATSEAIESDDVAVESRHRSRKERRAAQREAAKKRKVMEPQEVQH